MDRDQDPDQGTDTGTGTEGQPGARREPGTGPATEAAVGVPAAALGRAWLDERPWRLLSELAAIENRMAGRPGERRAAEAVGEALTAAGVRDVTLTDVPVRSWVRGTTTLRTTAPVERSFPAVALPFSPAADLEAPLVDVGYGTEAAVAAADLTDAVALARTDSPPGADRFVHRMESYAHAVEAGAVGFCFRNHVEGQLPPTGSLRFDATAPEPGVGVSAETGEWLAEYAAEDGRVALSVDARTEDGTSHNVHGVLGPDEGPEVLLLAHHDAHDVGEGALDNACGVAVVVGAAAVLAASDLGCRVRVAGVGAEETGLVGSAALADRLDLGAVRAVVNVDGAGRHRTLRPYVHGHDGLAALVEDVAGTVDHPVRLERDPQPYSDHWPLLRRGVPALQLHSDSGAAGRGWGHTAADTRDKADARTVRSHAMLTALLVARLTRAAPDRVDVDELRTRLRATGAEPGLRAAEIWPSGWD